MHINYFICVILFILLKYDISSSELVSIPLKRMKSALHTLAELKIHPLELEKKILKATHDNDTVQLFKYLDSQFYGELLIGHPGQLFTVIFDTAWANSWVPSKLCSVTDIACEIHSKYDSSISSTYKRDDRPISVNFGKYQLSGKFSNDLVHIGHVNITEQVFAEMFQIPYEYLFVKADGIFGLAFPALALGNATPFFDNLVNQKTIKRRIFSIYFNRDPSTNKGGSLFLGGSENKHYLGNFTYADVTSDYYWQISASGIAVKGLETNFCQNNCSIIIDSSTNIITGPPNDIDALSLAIQSRKFILGRYMVPCGKMKTLPTVTFTISNKEFVLKGRDYIQQISWNGFTLCLTAFKKYDYVPPYKNMWTLGAVFMSRFYVEFDAENKRIGFADIRQ